MRCFWEILYIWWSNFWKVERLIVIVIVFIVMMNKLSIGFGSSISFIEMKGFFILYFIINRIRSKYNVILKLVYI